MLGNELNLFVLEGAWAEGKMIDSLERHFLGDRFAVRCVYDAEIYQLYKQLKADDFALDIVNVLKERSPENAEGEIYMKCPSVSVLSAFPMFVLDYYGCKMTASKLGKSLE